MPIKARELDSIDAAISAQLDILRHTADVNQRVIALIEAMRLDLIKQIPSTPQVNKARIKALINKSSAVIDDYYTQARDVVDDSLNVVAQISAQETVVGLPVGLVAALPTVNQFKSIVSNQMIEGAPSAEWWSRQSDDTAFKFANALRQGIVQGESTSLIVDRVNSIVGLAERNSYSLVHTSIQQAANDAALATIKKNDDIYKGYRHLSTLDSNTSAICIARSNLEWDFEHNPIGHSLPWNPAPSHWACLLGDSLVSATDDVTGVSKRWFDGKVFIIKTASGKELSCTPNHPILTNSGWVAAEMLNIGGNVISNLLSERIVDTNRDDNDVIPTIHDFSESFLSSREVLPVPVPVSSEDFHGDGIGSEVAVVYSDSFLLNSNYSSFLKHFIKDRFVNRDFPILGFFERFSFKLNAAYKHFTSTHFGIGRIGKFLSFFKGCYSHSCELLLTAISYWVTFSLNNFSNSMYSNAELFRNSTYSNTFSVFINDSGNINLTKNSGDTEGSFAHNNPVFSKDSLNNALINREFLGDGFSPYAGSVFVDDIVGIECVDFSGHVYNLETVKGWYVANGIITHNCRSRMMGILRTFRELGFDIDEPKGLTRSSAEGQIARETSFDEFLKRRTIAEQDGQLGVGRAQLWRDGKITLKQLVDGNGNPMSLEALKAKYNK
jgi:hypothetical protein